MTSGLLFMASSSSLGITDMLDHPFMRRALLAGLVIAALAGVVGYLMVLRAQVFARDALSHVTRVAECEMNSATDNPLVFADTGEVISGGNFHAQPIAQAADLLAAAAADLSSISERRVENLVNPDLSGLPGFLTPHPGLNSGMMLVQVLAAALVSENKAMSFPASVDSIPTSANREDHVPMSTAAARKCRAVVTNTTPTGPVRGSSRSSTRSGTGPWPPGRRARAPG